MPGYPWTLGSDVSNSGVVHTVTEACLGLGSKVDTGTFAAVVGLLFSSRTHRGRGRSPVVGLAVRNSRTGTGNGSGLFVLDKVVTCPIIISLLGWVFVTRKVSDSESGVLSRL